MNIENPELIFYFAVKNKFVLLSRDKQGYFPHWYYIWMVKQQPSIVRLGAL